MLAAISVNWQELLANYWPHIVAVIAGLLGWNNRKEIAAAVASAKGTTTPVNGVTVQSRWSAEKAAPQGATDFVAEILSRTEGMPADKVVVLLATEGLTPDAASKAAAAYFRGQAKP